MVLGASHGGRIADTLRNDGYEVTDLTDRGWKLSKSGVTSMAEKLARVTVSHGKDTQVILSVLDSSLFWGESDEGLAPSVKLADHRFHIEGRVVLAGKDVINDRFNMLEPILQAAGKHRVVLMSPVPRYIAGGCCSESSHCSGWEEDNAAFEQLIQLERTRHSLRDCVFRSKFKSIMVMNPVKLFGGGRDLETTAEALKAVWGADPVHPAAEVYQRIVEEMVTELESVCGNKLRNRGRKRGRSPSMEDRHASSSSSRRDPLDSSRGGWRLTRGGREPRGGGLSRGWGGSGGSDRRFDRQLPHARGSHGVRFRAHRGWARRGF